MQLTCFNSHASWYQMLNLPSHVLQGYLESIVADSKSDSDVRCGVEMQNFHTIFMCENITCAVTKNVETCFW
jgi:hypothetical protein